MAILEQIKADRMVAMKAHSPVKGTLTTLLGEIQRKHPKDATDAEVIKVVKAGLDSLAIMVANKKQAGMNIDLEQLEVEALTKYMPTLISESETIDAVKATIAELNATTMKDMGKVMGALTKKYGASIDNAVASVHVKAILG